MSDAPKLSPEQKEVFAAAVRRLAKAAVPAVRLSKGLAGAGSSTVPAADLLRRYVGGVVARMTTADGIIAVAESVPLEELLRTAGLSSWVRLVGGKLSGDSDDEAMAAMPLASSFFELIEKEGAAVEDFLVGGVSMLKEIEEVGLLKDALAPPQRLVVDGWQQLLGDVDASKAKTELIDAAVALASLTCELDGRSAAEDEALSAFENKLRAAGATTPRVGSPETPHRDDSPLVVAAQDAAIIGIAKVPHAGHAYFAMDAKLSFAFLCDEGDNETPEETDKKIQSFRSLGDERPAVVVLEGSESWIRRFLSDTRFANAFVVVSTDEGMLDRLGIPILDRDSTPGDAVADIDRAISEGLGARSKLQKGGSPDSS